MVTVEYNVDPANAESFTKAINAHIRRVGLRNLDSRDYAHKILEKSVGSIDSWAHEGIATLFEKRVSFFRQKEFMRDTSVVATAMPPKHLLSATVVCTTQIVKPH
jgi:hypothetical protein